MPRLQKIVAFTMTEAEYIAVTEACKELIWLKDYLKELDKEQEALSLSDNQSVIDHVNNLVYHDRTKHIDMRYRFIHKLFKDGVFSPLKIHTSQNPADILNQGSHDGEAEKLFSFRGSSSLKIRV